VPKGADSRTTWSRASRPAENGCANGAVPVTEIRAGIIVGRGSAAYEVMRDLRLPPAVW